MEIEKFRQHYDMHQVLDEQSLHEDPFKQFEQWFKAACEAEVLEPNAVSVATVDENGIPSQRNVLMKLFDHKGFVFFTNYKSRKARHIDHNSHVSLLFSWIVLQRQLIIIGKAEKISKQESIKYFATRPRGSQLGAWCSQQSSVIKSRHLLEAKLEELKKRFSGGKIEIPLNWGGYRVVPDSFEFWQGQPDRLHDRFQYTRTDQTWQINRLAP